MNRILLTTASLVLFLPGFSQKSSVRGEFATNLNGLMYNESDMKSLRFIVDSLNLRFKTCDLNKTYYSYPQTRVYSVSFESETNDLKNIVEQLEKKISFREVISNFPSYISSIDSSDLFIRVDKDNKDERVHYMQGNPRNGYDYPYWDKKNNIAKKELWNEWIYNYSSKDNYSKKYSLTCTYFPQPWKQAPIPEEYGRLILYVDCMIDTSASVFLTDKVSGGWYIKDEKKAYYNLEELADYLDDKMSEENNNKQLMKLRESQKTFAVKELKDDATFRTLLAKTIDDYVKNKTPDYDLEFLANKMDMYDKELLMKRCYRIMGTCSQDSRPREHARDIAILAAQAHSWDIFLRAHLDIMNDRFERVSDGSYAWGQRKTYLKELEELNLNIVDLMLGLSLRAENVANNHYYGTIWRMGWALTESKERNVFEEKAVAMMKDDSLDEFNRGLIFLLYQTYISYLNDAESKQKRDSLKENIDSFPLFIQNSIQKMDEPKNKRGR